MRTLVLLLLVLLMCSLFSGLVLGRDDPIEVLCLTHAGHAPWMYLWLRREPMIDAVVVPAAHFGGFEPGALVTTPDQVHRQIRRYFPRGYKELTEYEFILFNYAIYLSYFTTTQLEWMRKAVEEKGLGALHDPNIPYGSGTSPWAKGQPWAQSVISDVFPNDADAVLAAEYKRTGSLEVIINQNPTLPRVLTPYKGLLPLLYPSYVGIRLMIPKEGSQTYAWAKTDVFREFAFPEQGMFPYVLGWRYGKAYTWSLSDHSRVRSGFWGYDWGIYKYGQDAWFGMLLYSTGRDLPEDVVMVHKLKERFREYAEAKGFIYSLIDFVEKFEVNTNVLLGKAVILEEKWKEGRRLYLAQEWDDSRVIMEQLVEDVRVFTDEAISFKNRALFWVYVTEWATVTATSLLAGFVLWTLMVSRRFYRKIDQTRLRPPPSEVGENLQYRDDNRPWWRKERLSRLLAIR